MNPTALSLKNLVVFLFFTGHAFCAGGESGDEFKALIREPRLPEDALLLIVIFVIILVFTWLWEITNDVTEWACLVTDQKHILAMREKLFKELTLLGAISLILFMVAHSSTLSTHSELVFEFVHLALFALFGVYSLLTLGIIFLSIRISMRWEKLEEVGPQKTFDRSSALKDTIRKTWITYLNPWFRYQLRGLEWDSDYHQIRLHFLNQHKLPRSFKFNKYLGRCMKEVFGEIAQLHWSVGVVILFGNIIIWFSLLSFRVTAAAPLWITAAFLIIVTFVINWKASSILTTLRDDTTYLESLNRKQDARDTQALESKFEKQIQSQYRLNKSIDQSTRHVTFSQVNQTKEYSDELSEIEDEDPKPSSEAISPEVEQRTKPKKNIEKKDKKEKLKKQNQELKEKNQEKEKKLTELRQELENIKKPASLGSPILRRPQAEFGDLIRSRSTENVGELHQSRPFVPRISTDLRKSTDLRRSGVLNFIQPEDIIDDDDEIYNKSFEEVSSWESQSESSWSDQSTWTSEDDKPASPTNKDPPTDKKPHEHHQHRVHHHHHHHFRKKHKSQYHHEHLESAELAWITKAVVPLWYGEKTLADVLPYFFWCIAPRKSIQDDPDEVEQQLENPEKHAIKLFWFNRPFFLIYTIQLIMFMQAIFLGISLALVFDIFDDDTHLAAEVLAILLSVFLLVGVTPSIIEKYSIIANVGALSKEEYLSEIKERYHKSELLKSYLSGNVCYDDDCLISTSHHGEGRFNLRRSMANLHREEQPQPKPKGGSVDLP